MKRIDSDALQILTKSLGLTGPGAQITELTDGTVDQALDVVPIIRRSRTQMNKEGIYTAVMRNAHTDAETVTSTVTPYSLPNVSVIAPWPNPVPPQFDMWLLSASVVRISGGGTLGATISIRYPGQQGWGVQDAGGALIASAVAHRLAHWDAVVTVGTVFGVQAGSEDPTAFIGIRIPRGSTELIFISVSSLTSAWECQLTLGLFPVALGQDGLV